KVDLTGADRIVAPLADGTVGEMNEPSAAPKGLQSCNGVLPYRHGVGDVVDHLRIRVALLIEEARDIGSACQQPLRMIFEDDGNAGALRLVVNASEGVAEARHQALIGLGQQRMAAS